MIGRTLLNVVTIRLRIIWLAVIAPRWRSLTLLAVVVLAATWLAW